MTPEEKKKLFEDNPNNFIFKKDIVVGVVRTDNGPAMCLNIEKREEMTRALGEIQVMLIKETIKGDINRNVPKPGGIMNFARKRF